LAASKRGNKDALDVSTPAITFLSSNEALSQVSTDVVETVLGMPKGVKKLVRMYHTGLGHLQRDCVLCGASSNSGDPALGDGFALLWAAIEEDGVTIIGHVDWHCSGQLRRRWKGWTVPAMKVFSIFVYVLLILLSF